MRAPGHPSVLPAALAACALLTLLGVALRWPLGQWSGLGLGALLAAQLWRDARQAGRHRRRLEQALEAMQAGIALFDADDRLVVANAESRRLYAPLADRLTPGARFEDLLRAAVRAGLVPAALENGADGEAWIAERLARHRAPEAFASALRRMPDGRWRRISEQRLPDGGVLAFSIDVTESVEQQQALHDARAQAERAQLQLREAIEAMPAGIEVYDEHDRLLIYNQRLVAMYPHLADQMAIGHTFEALVRRSMAQGLVPSAEGNSEAWLAARMAGRGHGDAPLLQKAHSGAWFHVYETRTASGAVVGVRLDVSELVQQREALRDAQARAESARETLEDALDALPEGFALFDADDRLVLCNQRYRELYVASAPVIAAGTRFEDIVRYGLERGQYPQAAADPETWLADRVRRHRHPSGEPLLQELPGNRWLRIDERQTRRGGIAGVRSDVSEMVRTRQQLEALNVRLEALSTTDALTGVSNRRLFDERLAEEMRRSQRHGQPLALLLIDIDHFKRYNDHYGHPAGDAALRRVATLLCQQARRPGDLAARYGGEEFALLLPHADEAAALAVAERCVAALANAAIAHADSPTAPDLTLSIGVAAHRAGAPAGRADLPPLEAAAALIARADTALYAAKEGGRAGAVVAPRPLAG